MKYTGHLAGPCSLLTPLYRPSWACLPAIAMLSDASSQGNACPASLPVSQRVRVVFNTFTAHVQVSTCQDMEAGELPGSSWVVGWEQSGSPLVNRGDIGFLLGRSIP